jgi:hypothetical protein
MPNGTEQPPRQQGKPKGKIFGMPTTVVVIGAGVIVAAGYYWYRQRSQAQSTSAASALTGTSPGTAYMGDAGTSSINAPNDPTDYGSLLAQLGNYQASSQTPSVYTSGPPPVTDQMYSSGTTGAGPTSQFPYQNQVFQGQGFWFSPQVNAAGKGFPSLAKELIPALDGSGIYQFADPQQAATAFSSGKTLYYQPAPGIFKPGWSKNLNLHLGNTPLFTKVG